MPPKKPKSGAGAKLAWEAELSVAEINDVEWNCQVHFVLGEDPAATQVAVEKLTKSIGQRERFSMLTPENMMTHILDKKLRPTTAKHAEVFDICKHVEHGGEISDLNDLGPVVLSRLVKFYLLRQRELDQGRILAKMEKHNKSETPTGGKAGKKSPGAGAPKGGKGGKDEETGKKEWSDLKKRGEVDEEEEKDIFIDDEPDDGPSHYILLIGFSEANLLSLLTEQCVDISSVIQIKNEGDDALEPYQFWNDLSTVFRRGLKKKSLIHTTRWQLTAFKKDLDGLQLFDEVATLCYDLLDQRKAFNDFCDSVKIIQTPYASIPNSDEIKVITERYNSQLENVPLVAQSVNVVTHALRESVVQIVDQVEVKVEEKKDETIKNLLSTALSGLDLDDEESENLSDIICKPETNPAGDQAYNQLYYKNDYSSLRLAGLNCPIRTEIEAIEKEMLRLYPTTQLFQLATDLSDCPITSAKLGEIDYALAASGDFSESQIKRILLQLSAEVIPLETVGENGRIYETNHETFAPWDNPNQLIELADGNKQHKAQRSLNDYSIYERLNYDSAIQVLSESIRESSSCSVMKLARDNGSLVTTYTPLGDGVNANQNVYSWQDKALTYCGFRQWIEHFQNELGDWLEQREIERKQKEEEEKRKAEELKKQEQIKQEEMNQDEQPGENIFIMPDSLKKSDLENTRTATESALKQKKSSSRRSLKGSAKGSRSNSKTKVKKSSSRSSSRSGVSRKGSSEKKLRGKENEVPKEETPEQQPSYQAYDVGVNLLSASGNERKILTADGGSIRIKQVGFVNQGDNLSICIENDDSLLHVYQANPRETSNKSLDEEKKLDEPADENDEVKSVASTTLPDREEIPSSTFSSVFCSFSDGIKASFSTNGPCGRPKNWETESSIEERKFGHKLATASPTPSRDTASSSAKGTGKKAKGKKVSDLSIENQDQSLNSRNPSQMEEKDFENDIQQVYISTPDGLNIRFGLCQDNRLMIKISKPGLSEIVRVVTFDSVLRILEEQDFEILSYLTGEISGVKDGEPFKIDQNGERNNGTSYLQYQGTDPITKNSMTIRSDGLIRVNRVDEAKLNEVDQVDQSETNICQFPDGTRVTRNNAETRIENPLYPLVLFEEDGKKALVILSNGSVIQVESNGNYHVTSSNGGSFAVGQDGTVLFTSKQDGASTHIVRQKSNSILEVIEPDGMSTIQISNTGGTSILKSVEEEDEGQGPTNTLDPVDSRPRYFYIQNNEAYEFYSKIDGHKVFSEIEHDPECAILKQNIPDAPHEKSATVICPFKVNNNWSIQEYTEENIIPTYLQQVNLTKCGGDSTGRLPTEIPSEQIRLETTLLTQRNFVIGLEVTNDMKEKVLGTLAKLGVENKNQSDSGQEIQENMDSGPERNKLLSRFLVLAAEQNVEDLRLKWLEATAPPVTPPQEAAKPKLSAEDWERIKNGHEKTKMNLKALKERTVPNYWQTSEGKTFLSSGKTNCATEAQKTLPKLESVSNKDTKLGQVDAMNQSEDIAEEIVTTAIQTGHSLVNLSNGPDSFDTSKVFSNDLSHDVRSIISSRCGSRVPAYPHHRLQFNPEIANFGILEEDQLYRMKIELKNTGMFTVRFKMTPLDGVKFKYKMGPIPAGMSTMVELEMMATGGVLREDGLFDLVHTLVMTNQNRETTQLAILARIIPKSEIEKRKMLKKPTVQLSKNVKRLKNNS